ncbi:MULTISPECIES: LVIVD repeat-containing protein [unclassified Myxococcus]|uniref:LVIVD repeat-containing protein n=1 Tax=unclassified Myxococcus TaxID=2648731 RepID=UPI0020C7340A|nr:MULTISPECIES: hypothetical protein [unclassified Myxococcus]
MKQGLRTAGLMGLLALAGCDSDPKAEPWDGLYTPLKEQGDIIADTGPFATCTVRKDISAPCGSPEVFDLSSCNRASLDTLEREGAVYRGVVRVEYMQPQREMATAAVGLRLSPDGRQVEFLNGIASSSSQLGDGQFSASMGYTNTASGVYFEQFALGCEAVSPREFVGCYSYCADGSTYVHGTFRAERMSWARGEAESSGGLKLRSESYVELGQSVDVFVAKDHAYVVSIQRRGEPGGLTVFDVKDRRRPVFKTSISLPGDNYWNGVWSKGDALYVASASSGLIVFDISNPASPVFLQSYPGGGPLDIHTVLVDGDRLYAMSTGRNAEVLLFDVTTPTEPRLLHRESLGGIGTGIYGVPHDAFAYGDRLYVSHMSGGYQILDVRNPENFEHLGEYTYYGAVSHHSAVGTLGGHTVAFEGGERQGAHLRVLKVDDPTNIELIGEFKLRDVASIHNMLLVGTRLYIAWYHEGLRVLDVSNPTKPRQVAHFNTYRESDPKREDGQYEGALGIRVPGDGHVYVVDDARGLLIFDEP